MTTRLKLDFEIAIAKVIEKYAEDGHFGQWIHPELVPQMATAACAVFDAATDAQLFAEENK